MAKRQTTQWPKEKRTNNDLQNITHEFIQTNYLYITNL